MLYYSNIEITNQYLENMNNEGASEKMEKEN